MEFPVTIKALCAGDAHSREDAIWRKRPRSARECAKHILFCNRKSLAIKCNL